MCWILEGVGPEIQHTSGIEWTNYLDEEKPDGSVNLVAREISDHGKIVERILWKNGARNGIQREWYKNGQAKREAPYENDLMNGVFREWNPAGALIGQYVITKGEGIIVVYNSRGELAREEHIKHNESEGLVVRRESDHLSFGWARHGVYKGKSFEIYLNGDVAEVSTMTATGEPSGVIVRFQKLNPSPFAEWFLKGRPTTAEKYAEAARDDVSLPAYYEDLNRYKEILDDSDHALAARYLAMKRVKIPLQFDAAGRPLLAE